MRFGISKRGLGASAKFAHDKPGGAGGSHGKLASLPLSSDPQAGASDFSSHTHVGAGAAYKQGATAAGGKRKRVESESGRGFGDSGAAVAAVNHVRDSGRALGAGAGHPSGGPGARGSAGQQQPGAGVEDAHAKAGVPSGGGAGAFGGMFAASRPSANVPFRVPGIKKKGAGLFKAPRMKV
jgi:hypothetical protein